MRRFSTFAANRLKVKNPVPSDLEIAQTAVVPKPITQIAKESGILDEELEVYGTVKAKVSLSIRERLQNAKKGKLVAVTGINPTPFGEGKTTMAVGIHQAMTAHLGMNAFCNIRQPSLGPVFGVKGGAAGGGYSQVIPMEEFNLHLTGDFHAVAAAHNLLGAALDSRMIHETNQKPKTLFKNLCPLKKGERKFAPPMLRRLNRLGINKTKPEELDDDEIKRFACLDLDHDQILWRRVVDMNDRALREIDVGFSEKNFVRRTGFDIASASECMAVLALSTSLTDMKERLSKIVVGISKNGDFVTADDIGCAGAMAAIMGGTLRPNLMQTLEGGPVFVHGGPFANIAHGCSSVLADHIALPLVGENGYVLTEAGFGADIGLEKFMNIKCRMSGLEPDCVVLVATIRALKMHGGGSPVSPGKPLPAEYTSENVELVTKGAVNMQHHIRNARQYGTPVVVCINAFPGDSDAELAAVRASALKAGAFDAVPCKSFEYGGEGACDLAKSIDQACKEATEFQLLYPDDMPLRFKIQTIASTYGANNVIFSDKAAQKLADYENMGYGNYPICMAKTPLSLTDNPELKGCPTNFDVTIRDVKLSAGAGFVVAYLGDIMTMPGLTTRPAYFDVDIDDAGQISGLF